MPITGVGYLPWLPSGTVSFCLGRDVLININSAGMLVLIPLSVLHVFCGTVSIPTFYV